MFYNYNLKIMPNIIQCSNNIKDVKDVLTQLIDTNGKYAFFSYIDGEYGIRLHVYYSLGRIFYSEMNKKNISVVALVFKGQTWSVRECCDTVIEIQGPCGFSHNKELTDDEYANNKYNPNWVPTGIYTGTDGLRLEYYKGFHDKEYENMINEFNFSNIFYTTHCCGSKYTNPHSETNLIGGSGYLFKIEDENVILDNIQQNFIEPNIRINTLVKGNDGTRDYLVWARNTNKCPHKNFPVDLLEKICKFCISTNRICHVIQDFNLIELPEHKNIINYRRTDDNNGIHMKGSINLDNIIELSKKCCVYIGADSGASEILAANINIPIKMTGWAPIYLNIILPQRKDKNMYDNPYFNSLEELLLIK